MWICQAIKFFLCGEEYFASFTTSSALETAEVEALPSKAAVPTYRCN